MQKPRSLRGPSWAFVLALPLAACSSALDMSLSDAGPGGLPTKPAVRPNGPLVQSDVNILTSEPIGWASFPDLGLTGTTGGADTPPVIVNTVGELITAAAGTAPGVIQIGTSMSGSVKVGSNKTIEAAPGSGAVFTGHIGFSHAFNDILRDLKIVGNNCTDTTVAACMEGSGADAVTIQNDSHHIWVDHCDISDGSDGNLDITSGSDYVTVSWTKFSYSSPPRAGGHLYSNLIGSSDSDTGDTGHLRITFHHDWWADNVSERMPRARFGKVHLFNNLYMPLGNPLYAVGVGVSVNILLENNDFVGLREPVSDKHFPYDPLSVAVSYGDLYERSIPPLDIGTEAVFTPPYDYNIQPAVDVQMTVMKNAGPH
jgi:pectate lyase